MRGPSVWLLLIALGCGGEAARLITELQHDDPKVRVKAARALDDPQFYDNERVIMALTAAIDDTEPSVQGAAITSLADFRDKAQPALPELDKALVSPETAVRFAAARAIAHIEPTSTNYRQVFVESLGAGNAPLFLEVGQMGKNAQWVVPSLIELLDHNQTYIRALSARALGDLGVASDEVTAALNRRLKDSEPSVRRAAEAALEALQ